MDFKGVNFCVTQFATQFTHVFRQYQTRNGKQKLSLGKTVLELLSQICEKMAKLIHTMTFKKCKKKSKS